MNPDADLDPDLRSPQRQLIELRIEHADLDSLIDRAVEQTPVDDLALRPPLLPPMPSASTASRQSLWRPWRRISTWSCW